MAPEYLPVKRMIFLVRDSIELANRIDAINPRIVPVYRKEPTAMPEERPIISSGLALGLKFSQMKFSCPCLGLCQYEPKHPNRTLQRISTCHSKENYLNCEAIKY